jgi:hypothetical protein
VYGRQNELIYGLLDSTGVLRVHIQFYGPLCSLQVFLGVVSAFVTATDYAAPLPVHWPYLLYCLDDRAHRRHIHPIPPQYTPYFQHLILAVTQPFRLMISSVYKEILWAHCYVAVGSSPAHMSHMPTWMSTYPGSWRNSHLAIAAVEESFTTKHCRYARQYLVMQILVANLPFQVTNYCTARAGRHLAPILIMNGLSQNAHAPLALCAAICRCGDGLFTVWAAENQVPRVGVVHTNLYLRSSS